MERLYINELYWTTIPFFEKAEPTSKKYAALKEKRNEEETTFYEGLSDMQIKRFEDIMQIHTDMHIEELNGAFREGIILGVNVVAEGLVLKNGGE